MLDCVTANLDYPDDPSSAGCCSEDVSRVVELPFLKERTPTEWLPIKHDAYVSRIVQFEKWLGEQPEDVVAVVGHSQYFKNMLGMKTKFGNCDVWSVDFEVIPSNPSDVKEDVNTADREEQLSRLKNNWSRSFTDGGLQEGRDDDSTLCNTQTDKSRDNIFPEKASNTEEMELPRGWRNLRRLYTFDSEQE